MQNSSIVISNIQSATWRDYLELCKPKVIALMIITAIVGMCLATDSFVSFHVLFWGNLGIALGAGSAAVINQLVDAHFDRLMERTQYRPIVQGKIDPKQAIIFAVFLFLMSMFILTYFINVLTAVLTFITLIGYAVVYTSFLKHVTVQNIVIGGAAGAAPPLLGWVAVTGHLDAGGFLLMMIIFVWTPPHFWSLAIHRVNDYAKAKIPMLPNKYGIPFTKYCILLYTFLLLAATLLPFAIAMCGWIYLIAALILNAYFLYYAIAMLMSQRTDLPMRTFKYSIFYLFALFIALLIDHYF